MSNLRAGEFMMIFLRYESFRVYLRSYPVTSAIIALNMLFFIFVALNGGTTGGENLYRWGAFLTFHGDPYGLEEPWRYVTSVFMHAGFQHLLFNMFALLVFAPPLERLLRSVKYGIFYLLCGLLGNLFSAVITMLTEGGGGEFVHLSVGASGAIYGVYGAYLYLSLFRKAWLDDASRKTVYLILGAGIIYSIILPTIDLWAHVGGGIAGFLMYGLFDRAMVRRQRIVRR
ncbi:Membrane associated serine protease, rhomboid family [Paenibacillus algorifonticola]|uniref:Membrane associated serine protease, rhomboid family n=2 Tax=Paenibacillus algorifonticola TaxID=684063 RepID=A0A1I1ZYY1_9BACL|nr:Membrane associated serine protease, rhomboid family [Paenibacillus algorifonticola]